MFYDGTKKSKLNYDQKDIVIPEQLESKEVGSRNGHKVDIYIYIHACGRVLH